MKKVLAFMLLFVLAGTFAGAASTATAAPLDPCAVATFIIDVVPNDEIRLWDTQTNLTSIVSYYLESGGQTVGHGFSKYTSQSFADGDYVASEETAIIDAFGLTVFGQSANTVDGIAGAAGVITGAVQFDGVKRNDIAGTYIFISDDTGGLHICVFLEP
jgi:hypothetical protein